MRGHGRRRGSLRGNSSSNALGQPRSPWSRERNCPFEAQAHDAGQGISFRCADPLAQLPTAPCRRGGDTWQRRKPLTQGGVSLGVHDPVHVLGPADHPQLGHGLVGGDDQLHARALGGDQPLAGRRVDRATETVDRLVLAVGDVADEAEGLGPGAAPDEGRLAPGGVVGQGRGGRRRDAERCRGGRPPSPLPSSASTPAPNGTLEPCSGSSVPTTGVICSGTRRLRAARESAGPDVRSVAASRLSDQ